MSVQIIKFWIDPKVIYGLTKYHYKKSNFCYNSNSILKGLLRMCSHEKDIEDKGRGRRGVVKQHTDEFWGHRDALERIQGHQDQNSYDERACGIYGRLAMSIHRSSAVRAGVNRKRHRDRKAVITAKSSCICIPSKYWVSYGHNLCVVSC